MADFGTPEEVEFLFNDLKEGARLRRALTGTEDDLLQRAIDGLISLVREKVVEIEIFEGANFKLKTLPVGATLVVRKFNVQGTAFSTKTYEGQKEADNGKI